MPIPSPKHNSIYTVTMHLSGPSQDSALSAITYSAVGLNDADGTVTAAITDVDGIATRCDAQSALFWPAFAESAWQYRGTTVTAWNAAGEAVDSVNIANTVIPSGSSNVMPPGNCYLVRKVVGRPAGVRRAPKGHWFMPCVNENVADNAGRISASLVTQLTATFQGFIDGLKSNNAAGSPVSMQLEYKATKTATSWSRAPIVSVTVDPVITFLRKRGR